MNRPRLNLSMAPEASGPPPPPPPPKDWDDEYSPLNSIMDCYDEEDPIPAAPEPRRPVRSTCRAPPNMAHSADPRTAPPPEEKPVLLAPSLSMRKNRKNLTLGNVAPGSPGSRSATAQRSTGQASPEGSTSGSSWRSDMVSSSASSAPSPSFLNEQLANLDLGYMKTRRRMSTMSSSSASTCSSYGCPAASPMQNAIDELSDEQLRVVRELGHGNGGTVSKCVHIPTGITMARKVVHISMTESSRKQIIRELQIMHECASPYLVAFYGAYVREPHICICMEFMDCGSLDSIYKKMGPLPENILGHVAFAVVSGLTFLYDEHKIMHRDIKPSNILMSSNEGSIKLCDFGVSGELIDSVTDTFVGTSMYMSPERISGAPYTIQSDVWSLGISLVELALGRFPFSATDDDSDSSNDFATNHTVRPRGHAPSDTLHGRPHLQHRKPSAPHQPRGVNQMAVLELLQYIVNEPAPELPPGDFSADVVQFIRATLHKDPPRFDRPPLRKPNRPSPKELLTFPWMRRVRADRSTDLKQFAASVLAVNQRA